MVEAHSGGQHQREYEEDHDECPEHVNVGDDTEAEATEWSFVKLFLVTGVVLLLLFLLLGDLLAV